MIALPDINVLIARGDAGHQFHQQAKTWLRTRSHLALATCAVTENSFLRIYGHPNYPGGPGSPAAAARDLAIAFNHLMGKGILNQQPLKRRVSAIRHESSCVTRATHESGGCFQHVSGSACLEQASSGILPDAEIAAGIALRHVHDNCNKQKSCR